VGSTGTSTGPHLDYRIWKNGVNIDPLKVPQEPAEPISKQNEEAFKVIRDRVVAELNGTATPDMIVTQLDSLVMHTDTIAATKADTTKLANESNVEEAAEKSKSSRRERRSKK
jgi:hypothetical protein